MNTENKITPRQHSILHHTVYRAAGGRYCGGGEDMDELVKMGYMEFLCKPAWAIDSYYVITKQGRAALEEYVRQ